MTDFTEMLKYILPSLIVFATTWILVKSLTRTFMEKMKMDLRSRTSDITIPIRFQAYERVILFLERISLDSLLIRVSQQGMNARQLQSELLASIRSEFEHNLSQQVYMSDKAWDMIRNSRNQITVIINKAAENIDPTASSQELSVKIIESLSEYTKSPTQSALEYIKREIRELY